jgi:hypothetical protein
VGNRNENYHTSELCDLSVRITSEPTLAATIPGNDVPAPSYNLGTSFLQQVPENITSKNGVVVQYIYICSILVSFGIGTKKVLDLCKRSLNYKFQG